MLISYCNTIYTTGLFTVFTYYAVQDETPSNTFVKTTVSFCLPVQKSTSLIVIPDGTILKLQSDCITVILQEDKYIRVFQLQ